MFVQLTKVNMRFGASTGEFALLDLLS